MNDFCIISLGDITRYDSKTTYGPWAYLCKDCYGKVGTKIPGLFFELKKENKHEG